MFNAIDSKISEWLISLGISEGTANLIADFSGFLVVLLLAIVSFYVARQVLVHGFSRLARKSKTHWDDKLLDHRVFHRLAFLAPALVIHTLTQVVIPEQETAIGLIELAMRIYIMTMVMLVIFASTDALNEIYQSYEISRTRPIKSFLQVIKIIIVMIYVIIIVTLIFVREQNFGWLAGLGAFSAVLLLVFKDPILGFTGGLQLAFNDMLRIGDWIEMPKFGADGNVTEVNLTTVKVQNWDKTITTIPTYALVTDSYKNWRGMEESGGRRIKRSVMIDVSSIRFCTPEMLERFMKFEHVADYVKKTEQEVRKYNEERGIDPDILVNGRRQTNIGVFRAYLRGYLVHHPKINQEMTFLIRQLQPTEKGLPMEVYVFSKVQAWSDYENIQSDIFDHIFAVIPQFDLKVFQNPSGSDFKKVFTEQP